jgi:DNA mismatch repair protein MSH5
VLEKFESYHLAQIGRQISDIVDFEQTELQHRTVVKPGVDEDLDRIKRSYDGLDHLLTEVSKAMADQVPHSSAILNIIYFPQLGFLIACRHDTDAGSSSFDGEQIEGWDRAFSNG